GSTSWAMHQAWSAGHGIGHLESRMTRSEACWVPVRKVRQGAPQQEVRAVRDAVSWAVQHGGCDAAITPAVPDTEIDFVRSFGVLSQHLQRRLEQVVLGGRVA